MRPAGHATSPGGFRSLLCNANSILRRLFGSVRSMVTLEEAYSKANEHLAVFFAYAKVRQCTSVRFVDDPPRVPFDAPPADQIETAGRWVRKALGPSLCS